MLQCNKTHRPNKLSSFLAPIIMAYKSMWAELHIFLTSKQMHVSLVPWLSSLLETQSLLKLNRMMDAPQRHSGYRVKAKMWFLQANTVLVKLVSILSKNSASFQNLFIISEQILTFYSFCLPLELFNNIFAQTLFML